VTTPLRLGFFTRVLDAVPAATRYQYAIEQIERAEAAGYDSVWVAQHHFHEAEGGLPSPLVFLAHVAARTERVRLGTAIITLPMEDPVRVAEDAVVADLLSGGRLELGFGSGGTASSFLAFGTTFDDRREVYDQNLSVVERALHGTPITDLTPDTLYPSAGDLPGRVWEATFSWAGAARIGARGNGLLLSKAQPPTPETEGMTFVEIQHRIIDTYLENLPDGVEPRILASRGAFVADSREDARRYAEQAIERLERLLRSRNVDLSDLDAVLAATNSHVGTPDEVIESLAADTAIERSTEVTFQVHSIDPPHELILRHIDLIAEEVAPKFGWGRHLNGVAS
jgi:putative FMN-dependent luciferase-like monooxygenase